MYRNNHIEGVVVRIAKTCKTSLQALEDTLSGKPSSHQIEHHRCIIFHMYEMLSTLSRQLADIRREQRRIKNKTEKM